MSVLDMSSFLEKLQKNENCGGGVNFGQEVHFSEKHGYSKIVHKNRSPRLQVVGL